MTKAPFSKYAHQSGTASADSRCHHCGKRGRKKCIASVCLNFCCQTEKSRLQRILNFMKG